MARPKKASKNIIIKRKEFLAGIQALAIYYEERTNFFISVKQQFGDDHPAVQDLLQELNDLGNIVSFFSDLVNENQPNTGKFN